MNRPLFRSALLSRLPRKGVSFADDRRATTLVEFSLVAPLLFIITFGIVDFGAVIYQFQALNTATAYAARMAATRGPVITGVGDCGPGVTGPAGAYCSTIAGSTTWTPITCTGASPGGNCNVTLMNRIVTEMKKIYPPLTINNLNITYSPSGLGFMGLGKPVPAITVTLTGVNASFIVMSGFGLNNITMPPFTTTITAEDMSGT